MDEELLQQEIQRQVGQQVQQKNQEIVNLKKIIEECQNKLTQQHNLINRLSADPSIYTTVLKAHRYPDPRLFRLNDEVIVIDPTSHHYLKGGKIISGNGGEPPVNDDGQVAVQLYDGQVCHFYIGTEGKSKAQIRLATKGDGSWAVVSLDGKAWEVRGLVETNLQAGDAVKIRADNKAIVGKVDPEFCSGPVCPVVGVSPDGIEIAVKGETVLVNNPLNLEVEEGDRIVCDHALFIALRKASGETRQRFKVRGQLDIGWDDIGGLDEAKQELRESLELAYKHPDLYSYYNVEPLKGFLIYGPPGCGKTLLARVCASEMARLHDKTLHDSGYIYVKGPEILNKWVGNTEADVRYLFAMGRNHYRKHGYKAILAIDEAESIMPRRGTRKSSDIADTIVPMFLGEMDGLSEQENAENPIVILLTNRPDVMEEAILRHGRISRHIKISRPDDLGAMDILDIHTRNLPFADPSKKQEILAVAISDLYSKSRILYRVNGRLDFTLADCVNGAMLQSLANMARIRALRRDRDDGTKKGVVLEDFRDSVGKLYKEQFGLAHTYDLWDFADRHQIQHDELQAERCFANEE